MNAKDSRVSVIQGKILDSEDRPVSGVDVFIGGSGKKAESDSMGCFSVHFHNSPKPKRDGMMDKKDKSEIVLIFSKIGYGDIKRKIELPIDKEQVLSIRMTEGKTRQLDDVAVNSKSAIQTVRESPFNVVALNATSKYNSTMDLGHLLGKASGVKLREAGGLGSELNVSINGFTGRNIKVFIDGVAMQGNSSSFQLNNIPVSFAERIEVYKGVVPIEFGSDAIGGAINIVTNRTTNTFLDASYSYGSFNTHKTNVIFGHTTPKGFSFQVNAYQNYSDNSYKIKSRLMTAGGNIGRDTLWFKRFHGAYHNEGMVAKLGWVGKKWADRLFFGATVSQDYREIQNAPGDIELVYGDVLAKSKGIQPNVEYYKRDLIVKGLTVRFSGNYNFTNNHTVDTSSYKYNWLGQRVMAMSKGERGIDGLADYDNNNYATSLNLSYRINKVHSFTVNDAQTGYARKIESDLPEEQLSEFEKMRRKSLKNVLGLAYRFRPNNNWNTNLFVKNYYQKVDGPYNKGDEAHPDYALRSESGNTTGYGFAATYFFKDLQFKASLEKAYRLPSDKELFGDETEEAGNADLKPEQSLNYNLGITLNKQLPGKDVLYVDVSGYYRDTKDYIQRIILPRSEVYSAVNFGNTRNLGVDIEARYYYKDKAMIGGTFTTMDLYNNEPNRDALGDVTSATYKDHMPNVPYRFGNLDAAYYWHGLGGKGNVLNIEYSLNYVGKFYLNWESLGNASSKLVMPTQISHDLSITYTMHQGKYNLTLEAQNLTGAELSDNFGILKPGRAIYGKFRVYLMSRKKQQDDSPVSRHRHGRSRE
ncbi:Outer membrane receptor proteins, mostly Fe transport [Arachidicoccus rhizosphaerae]|uniref:Outer membrane receptor proteins, mostly Fe transport n=1 Tax=Arachidicoccus rhizosphaerae TaxID=551991 RepID=A0A1H3Y4K4_9BACT|nr:TonB-dependent receptor plug domain-containing protein [Arachidicoccus rhizosphaerae]SEA06450.1 Outer membrane receptor proteins, mostly Fe transport [Arachidicoccus rhizosphaerae]